MSIPQLPFKNASNQMIIPSIAEDYSEIDQMLEPVLREMRAKKENEKRELRDETQYLMEELRNINKRVTHQSGIYKQANSDIQPRRKRMN